MLSINPTSTDGLLTAEAHAGSSHAQVTAVNIPLSFGHGAISPIVATDTGSGNSTNYFEPADIRHAYGMDQIQFAGSVGGDGRGQTIAIVDPYHDPNILNDLDAFDQTFSDSIVTGAPSLYSVYGAASSFLTVDDPQGVPPTPPQGQTVVETALDVEWAHALAPAAKIILLEAQVNSDLQPDLGDNLNAVMSAAQIPSVSVIPMSWGLAGGELSYESEWDQDFMTPTGHQPITFLASTGDKGAPGQYPAYSPNVVAVGGTDLTLDHYANYLGESAWAYSGGGQSMYEAEPAYQRSVQSSNYRTTPDVSFDAGGSVQFYDSYDYSGNPLVATTGTSFSVQAWGAIVAVADQGRVAAGFTTLDGPSQTLPDLYSIESSHFYDITTGSSGTKSGYDDGNRSRPGEAGA